jgi:hypothetical protein
MCLREKQGTAHSVGVTSSLNVMWRCNFFKIYFHI